LHLVRLTNIEERRKVLVSNNLKGYPPILCIINSDLKAGNIIIMALLIVVPVINLPSKMR
jgi:hypothetical protein